MDFSHSPKSRDLLAQLNAFMSEFVFPREKQHIYETGQGQFPVSFMEDLKALAKDAGLWNLFLPGLRDDEPGTRLTNLEYAPLAEAMGHIPWASEIFNCSAPDTGNMELLHMFATKDQREQWLEPLLAGKIRSAFAMTEPDVASSDATNIATSIHRDAGDYVINGRKWFITNACHPNCKVFIVMGKTDPTADRHLQQSMIIVPKDTPGVKILRSPTILNMHDPEGHAEILFQNVRVPASNLLGAEGEGFAMAQARLGPGRIHHCMRSIGAAEMALSLMCARAQERRAFGKSLASQGVIREWIAKSRLEIEQARLLTLKAAWKMDQGDIAAARKDISLIKVVAPKVHADVTDRAMQVFGAMGLTPDTPLANSYTLARALRYADGPDEVHFQTIAKLELKAAPRFVVAQRLQSHSPEM